MLYSNEIGRLVMADQNRPCLFHVAGPCFHPKCLESLFETIRLRPVTRTVVYCPDGNDACRSAKQ